MRRTVILVVLLGFALVAALALALRAGLFPLGVRGEWEWPRLPAAIGASGAGWTIGIAAVAAYSAFVGLGHRFLGEHPRLAREIVACAGLWASSIVVQLLVHVAAPEGYGLTKWTLALHSPGSSGYYTVAKAQIADARTFLAEYPSWIARQDALHVGTHPPGLFLLSHGLLRFMELQPGVARFVVDHLPLSVEAGFRILAQFGPLPRADRAALAMTGALTLLACGLTVVPLYAMARAGYSAATAWSAAALWPVIPSAILFQPAADTAFPLLSATALALAMHSRRSTGRGGPWLAAATGCVLAVGMGFTLAFLAIGLVVAIVLATAPGRSAGERALAIAATGAGFLGLVGLAWAVSRANPFVIWWWNQRNHARFYVEYPRSYLAWTVANPVELAVALGLPVTIWMAIGLVRARPAPIVAWAALAVLAILTLTGRSLSEVARLWLPMMPALLVASGCGMNRLGADGKALGATVALVGFQTLVLQATIQVVYPV